MTCEDRELNSDITQTLLLQEKKKKRFPESIGVYESGKYVIVYSEYTNPCAYSISILKGFELKNEGVIKSFENKIKQNNSQPSDEIPEFPYTPHELKNLIWKGPWRVLFNAVFMKVHDYIKLNKNGYTIKYSSKLACKNGRLRMMGNHF